MRPDALYRSSEPLTRLATRYEPLRLFSAQSFFNTRLPTRPPLAPDSARLVEAFASQLHRYSGHVVINTTEWSAPVYVVGATAPTVALAGRNALCPRPEGVFSGFQSQIDAVPVPPAAIPAAGTDKDLIVWQPSSSHLWELWRVLDESSGWSACWGGEITDAYSSDGTFPAPFGASAAGLSLLAGQIHIEDLEHGTIDHALEILVPDTAREFVWPADRTDGTSSAADAIPEGTRFRLDPRLNLGSLHLRRGALEIARAIQRYGMVVGDTSSGAVALEAQDPTPLTNRGRPDPYRVLLGPDQNDLLDRIPWSSLEVVSPSYRG